MAAVAEYVQGKLGGEAAVDPAAVQFAYEATHRIRKSTGQPVAVELTVRCSYHDQYHKEYYLTINPTPSL